MARKVSWRERDSRLGEDLLRLLLWVGTPIACVAFLWAGVPGVAPAWEARFGGGTPGVFTAQTESCGRYSCQWTGTFESDDGGVVRTGVPIGSGAPELGPGQTTPAVDTGGVVVYPEGGGWDFLLSSIVLFIAVGGLAVWASAVVRAVRRRRRT